jgi:hypothetical protein
MNEDVVNHIISYSFGICHQCNKNVHFSNLRKNVRIVDYKDAFDHDYFLPMNEIIKKRMCVECINKYDLFFFKNRSYIDIHNKYFT